ncbi:tripartite tricarboxylate transporter substrate binding protein [Pelagibius sp. CAU 1746]|uniref:Bug family tripartite tricarboxylate transporter substrate binding protein n=1 Tax=Pelagibius sp. CAU 1746 TaxID=3140370 RepID=UPI00325B7BCB
MKTFVSFAGTALAALSLTLTAPAVAQSYPDKPVNYIIPFGPGGESDITARHQQPFFQKKFTEELVVEYKPGGGGAVGWSQLNDYKGDGYTWMGVNLPHIIIKPLQKDVGFKTEDLTTVYMFHYTPDAIVVPADSDFKTLQDLIDHAKENPGKVVFSGSGKGTANHIAQIRFDKLAGVKTTYVPFKGTGAAVTALLGKQVTAEWGYTSVGAKQGDQVRMLAVAMDARHPMFPDVPTFKELGFDLVSGAYRGIAVPKSTPEELRKQISDMIGKINADPEFRKRLENDGMAMLDVPYEDMDAFLKEMTETYTAAAKEAGVLN